MGNLTRTHIPIYEVRPRRTLLPSRPSPVFLTIARTLSPVYLRFILKFQQIVLYQPDTLLSAFHQFQQGKTRLILAFRHPYGDEPQLLQHVFDCLVSREARKSGHPLPTRPHVRFVHGYEVALWGDALIRLALPLSGALPIHHLQADPSGMKRIRDVLLHGDCPLALAPEGQVCYRSGAVPRLESGTARMGFWCAKGLEKEGRKEQAVIVPVSVHYAFLEKDAKKLLRLITDLERYCGFSPSEKSEKTSSPFQKKVLSLKNAAIHGTSPVHHPGFRQETRNRLLQVEISLLELAETHYRSMYRHLPPVLPPKNQESISDAAYRQGRWDALMETALQAGEHILGIPVQPSTPAPQMRETLLAARIDRVYRIRREGWERIYPTASPKKPTNKATLPLSMQHRLAGEAWYAMRHMEFVDILEYLDTAYLDAENHWEGPTFDRLCETALNLHDLAHRMAGGNFTNRVNLLRKKAIVMTGEPINLSKRLPAYHQDMRAATLEVTEQMKTAFQTHISNDERRSVE